MQKVKQLFSRKRNIVICAVLAVVLAGGGFGGVYAYGVYTEQVAAQQEAERLEARLAAIDADLQAATDCVVALYSDESMAFLVNAADGESIAEAGEVLATIAAYAETDGDMTGAQRATLMALYAELESAQAMYDINVLFVALHENTDAAAAEDAEPVGLQQGRPATMYLATPGETTADTLSEIAGQLEQLKDAKPDFYDAYSAVLRTVTTELEEMQAAIDLVAAFFAEDGEIRETTTEEEITLAQATVETLGNPGLVEKLTAQLQQVSIWYTEKQEAAAAAEAASNASRRNNTGSGSGSTATTPGAGGSGGTGGSGGDNGSASSGEVHIISGYIGNGGLFDSESAARQWGYTMLDKMNEDETAFIYTGFKEITVLYSDGTLKFSIDMY